MNITITREYFPLGTNGRLYINGEFICYTIELPNRHNAQQVSCIPEGEYLLGIRFSKKFGKHLLVKNVPGRSLILIHPANYALLELRGCIAPVSTLLKTPGTGGGSKKALDKIYELIFPILGKETISLTIKQRNDDTENAHHGTHAGLLPQTA